MPDYAATRDRVEDYFDRTATDAWARLTSDARVSRVRQTVRAGRDRMRALMLSRLPADLDGLHVLDAGCGPGLMTAELAARGARVTAVDVAPQLLALAADRLAPSLRDRVRFVTGDMTDDGLGRFDAVVAMDSLIYYRPHDIVRHLHGLAARSRLGVVFSLAPRTTLLSLMWTAGRLFPRGDRSPMIEPQSLTRLAALCGPGLTRIDGVRSGFYMSDCLEFRP